MTLPASPLLADLLAPIAEEMQALEDWLEEQFAAGPPALQPLLAHAARFRGKRLRAAQVFLVAKACGNLRPEHRLIAGIIEMIHAASLMHDDLLDEAAERRSLDCLHVAWGGHAAVLLGDWVYSQAFSLSTTLVDPRCSRRLAQASMQLCAGEIHQNLTRRQFDLSLGDYLSQIDGKTAALFEAGGELAAYYAGADATIQGAAARHGLLAGRAFQMVDDILDLDGDAQKVGKSLGTDWSRGKMTLPLMELRDRLEPADRDRLAKAFAAGAERQVLFEAPFREHTLAAIQASHAQAEALLDQAVTALDLLPGRQEGELLAGLTRFVGSRRR